MPTLSASRRPNGHGERQDSLMCWSSPSWHWSRSMDDGSAVSALLVVGAPRSGTSVICHALNKLGVDFGDPKDFVDPETNKHNPIFFELTDLNRLNNEILASLGFNFANF